MLRALRWIPIVSLFAVGCSAASPAKSSSRSKDHLEQGESIVGAPVVSSVASTDPRHLGVDEWDVVHVRKDGAAEKTIAIGYALPMQGQARDDSASSGAASADTDPRTPVVEVVLTRTLDDSNAAPSFTPRSPNPNQRLELAPRAKSIICRDVQRLTRRLLDDGASGISTQSAGSMRPGQCINRLAGFAMGEMFSLLVKGFKSFSNDTPSCASGADYAYSGGSPMCTQSLWQDTGSAALATLGQLKCDATSDGTAYDLSSSDRSLVERDDACAIFDDDQSASVRARSWCVGDLEYSVQDGGDGTVSRRACPRGCGATSGQCR